MASRRKSPERPVSPPSGDPELKLANETIKKYLAQTRKTLKEKSS